MSNCESPASKLLTGSEVDATAASAGTIERGAGVSPYDRLVIDSDYIKSEAQEGRLTQILYAVSVERNGKSTFRAPTDADMEAIADAAKALAAKRPQWEALGVIPTEEFPAGNDMRPPMYGMATWVDFFTSQAVACSRDVR